MTVNPNNPDDNRELIGRYATGSLSEAERKRLFEAALADQELFDELAGEDALKQLFASPGAKTRLLASLTPSPGRRTSGWVWTAASAAAALIAVFGGAILFRHQSVREIAERRPPASASRAMPPPQIEAAAPQFQAKKKRAVKPETKALPAVEPALAEPDLARPSSLEANRAEPDRAVQEEAKSRVKEAPPAPPVPQPQQISPPMIAGFRALPQAPTPQAATLGALAAFGFSYNLTPDRKLRVTPLSNGFLTLTIGGGGTPVVLMSNDPLLTGVASEYAIPDTAAVLSIVFSAQQSAAGNPVVLAVEAADPTSGTKIDPNPSPQSRVTAVIPITPGVR